MTIRRRQQERRRGPARARRHAAPLGAALVTLLLLAGFLGGRSPVRAQSSARQAVSRGVADRFIDRVVDGEPVSFLYGNVYIDRDTVTAAADTGIVYRARGIYELYGNVVLTNDGAVLTCRKAVYNESFRTGDFFHDVRVVEDSLVATGRRGESRDGGRLLRLMDDALLVTPDYSVRADTIVRDRLTGTGEAFGHVRIMEPGALNLVTGDHAVFRKDVAVAEVDRNPRLVSREQEGGALTSTAGLMRFFRDEDRVVMIDSVRIRQGTTRARADTAVAHGRDRMMLTGNPTVSRGGTSTMYGDAIEFVYLDGELHRVILVGDARMEDAAPDSLAHLYQGLPTMDILEGDSISVEFENEEIRRTVVVGNARSIYTPLDLQDEVATNDVSGDTIHIHFARDQVRRVNVMGNMSGNYRFARVAAMREMLGRSRRLADLLATADSTGTAADALGASAADSAAALLADAAVRAQVDSIAALMGRPVPAEVANAPTALLDSLLTVALDSLATAGLDTGKSTMDFLATAQGVDYSGGAVEFDMRDKSIDIRDDGSLKYGTMTLTAQRIKLDTVERELYADGEPLVEDSETIAGDRMGYNFKHKTGAVSEGVTTFDNYYYVGDEIRRFEDTTLKICKGRMTSCDQEEPHYHFWSDKMKIRMEDKVVAAPIVMRVGHVPVFALPFYYKSLKQGRRSGILFPSFNFGWSSRDGRYIRDFGYYWATNDYTDFVFEGDWNENRDLTLRAQNAYRKRYSFDGNVVYNRKMALGDSGNDEWQFRWNHNQPVLFDDYTFRSKVQLASTKLSTNDLNRNNREQVNGQLTSNVYLTRKWAFANANLSASRDERTNAEDEDPTTDNLLYNMTLPQLALSVRQFTLLPQRGGTGQGTFLGELGRNTYFSQSYSFKADQQGKELTKYRNYNANGSWSLNVRPPRLWIFNVSGSASASQNWSRQESSGRNWIAETDSTGYYEEFDEFEEQTRPGVSVGATLGTVVYGLFPVQVGKLQAIRHTFRVNSGWRLTPGLANGRQAFGTSYTFGISNRFDVKYLTAGADSTLNEKKLDGVIDWSLGTSLNPRATAGNKWSDITSGLTIKPGTASYLKLKVSNTIDPEKLALKSTRFTYGLNFSGRLDTGGVEAPQENRRNAAIDRLGIEEAPADSLQTEQDAFDEFGNPRRDGYGQFEGGEDGYDQFYDRRESLGGSRQKKDKTEGGRYIPFDTGFNMSYSYNNATRSKTANTSVTFNTNLTRDWAFRYSASFNLVEGRPTQQRYTLTRDLHCWRLEFNRTINANNSEFGFRFYLISIPDLKLTRGREDYMSSPGTGFF